MTQVGLSLDLETDKDVVSRVGDADRLKKLSMRFVDRKGGGGARGTSGEWANRLTGAELSFSGNLEFFFLFVTECDSHAFSSALTTRLAGEIEKIMGESGSGGGGGGEVLKRIKRLKVSDDGIRFINNYR